MSLVAELPLRQDHEQARRLGSHDRFGVCWQGRAVMVVGLGKSGMAACRFLQRLGCLVRMTDCHDTEPLRALAAELRACGVKQIELGTHSRALLEGCQIVVVSPGVPESAEPIRWAHDMQIPIMSEIELAFRFCRSPIISVTGTNGKSQVVTLIQRVLRAAGKRAVACGNLGTPFSAVLAHLTPEAIAVVEVSSFQLLGCEQFRPTIGVLLNLGTNHLDRHQTLNRYLAAKARMFARQTPVDWAVLNGRDPLVLKIGQSVRAQRVWFGAEAGNPRALRLDPATLRALSDNAQAVLQVGRLVGIPDALTHQVIREFPGLEHRLEYVAAVHGVHVVNDSKSTTPESLLYALTRVPGSLVPIIGGKDKGLDFHLLKDPLLHERIRGIVLIGESRRRLRALFNGSQTVSECETLQEAIARAMQLAHPGDTMLFSPACASFDMFTDFEERGRIFKQLVRQLNGRVVGNPGLSVGPCALNGATPGGYLGTCHAS